MTATIRYEGNLHCNATHLQSGSVIETDAPTDNRGKGERFSPTDLICAALATCIITTMAMKAIDMNIELKGTTVNTTKHMKSDPRRIGKIDITVTIPHIPNIGEKERTILERVGHTCPVARSLSADVETNIEFVWE